jgi:hypothetical protein
MVDVNSKDLVTTDRNKFFIEYYAVHPDGYESADPTLYFILTDIMYELEMLCEDDIANNTFYDFYVGLYKIYWLFHSINLKLLYAQLQSFVIERNDTSLSSTDYVLLFYVSLQDEEVRNVISHLPLSMIYDMFMPVAEGNLEKWKASLENKS